MTYGSEMLDYQAEKEAQPEYEYKIECNRCHYRETLDKDPGKDWVCPICKKKLDAIENNKISLTKLLTCSNGHKNYVRNLNAECPTCEAERQKRQVKRHLEIDNDPRRQNMLQNTVEVNQILRKKREEHIKKEIEKRDAIIETPKLLQKLLDKLESLERK